MASHFLSLCLHSQPKPTLDLQSPLLLASFIDCSASHSLSLPLSISPHKVNLWLPALSSHSQHPNEDSCLCVSNVPPNPSQPSILCRALAASPCKQPESDSIMERGNYLQLTRDQACLALIRILSYVYSLVAATLVPLCGWLSFPGVAPWPNRAEWVAGLPEL